jgi:ubiquinone/menaquinone biosynthesis C-methylase UbiE
MKNLGKRHWGMAGVSPQVWDRIQSEAAVQEDERAAKARDNQDAKWVLDRVPAGARLIDLGCGSGRLMEMHQRRHNDPVRGWSLGVDLSWSALQAARHRLQSAGLIPRLIQANLVDLQCFQGAELDAAACLFSTLGMIRGYGNRLRFLSGVYAALRPGGLLVLHAHARWWHLTTAQGRWWLLRDIWARWSGRENSGEYRSASAPPNVPSLGHFTKGELVHLVTKAGFKLEECSRIEGGATEGKQSGGRVAWYAGLLPAHGWLLAARK